MSSVVNTLDEVSEFLAVVESTGQAGNLEAAAVALTKARTGVQVAREVAAGQPDYVAQDGTEYTAVDTPAEAAKAPDHVLPAVREALDVVRSARRYLSMAIESAQDGEMGNAETNAASCGLRLEELDATLSTWVRRLEPTFDPLASITAIAAAAPGSLSEEIGRLSRWIEEQSSGKGFSASGTS